ncbi:PRELI-like family-domain-containing protein [Gorgonomyces haynaldii]|nr:PRELI-like family-domain-containing protein [Gorgonomyces haynaldii]
MKLYEHSHRYDHHWDLLTFANFNKYPNIHSNHVISVDVISRHINAQGQLETIRLMQTEQPTPWILTKIGLDLPETNWFLEKSVTDVKKKEYEAVTHNLTMRCLLSAEESLSLVHRGDHTLFQCQAKVSAEGALKRFGSIIESAAVSRFQQNASKGKEALESVVERVKEEFSQCFDFIINDF